MGDVLTIGPARSRHGAVLIVTFLCLLLLTACAGGGSKPFAKGEGTPGPSGKTVPPIALIEVSGLPGSKLPQLKDALAVAAGKRDMAIVDSKLDSTTLTLTGSFHIAPDPAGAKLAYNWTLSDPAGTVLHTISAEELAPGSPSGDPWLKVTPAVLQRVAAYTAESLSSRLSQLGYATEIGGIPPPLDTYARAGPDADKDIDYETLYGPLKAPAAVAGVHPPLEGKAVAQAGQAGDKALAAVKAEPAEDKVVAAAAEPAKTGGRKQINAVAVLPVSGAPGTGNADLTRAMRQTLADAGWPVVQSPRENALTILGHVKLGPKRAKDQNVALAWTVKTPDGRTLGTVRQANDVPVGSLEAGFGENALFAAQAAAGGIYDLVKKYR
ncbi:MAG: hypothetical protein AB7S92_21165 [Parvibaculaceae bacterium]